MTDSRSTPELRRLTRAELVRIAKAAGIRGATRLKKADLIRRLGASLASDPASRGPDTSARLPSGQVAASSNSGKARRCSRAASRSNGRATGGNRRPAAGRERSAETAQRESESDGPAPRLLSVRPTSRHWCEVRWSVTRDQLRIAEAALGPERHHVTAVLHIERVGTEEEKALPRVELMQRVPVDLDEGCWYVRIDRPEECWQIRLGLQSTRGRFQPLMHSPRFCPLQLLSRATRLRPGSESPLPVQYSAVRMVSGSWPSSELAEQPWESKAHGGSASDRDSLPISLRLLLTLLGQCAEGCEVHFDGVPVDVAEDGSFAIPLSLNDGREVLPLSVVAPDGATQWTQVFTVELRQQQLTPQRLDSGR